MLLNATMTQAKQLIVATLDAPIEFWGKQTHVRISDVQEAGLNLKVAGGEQTTPGSAKRAIQRGLVPIRSLTNRHRQRIAEHIIALSEPDRYLRFGYNVTDSQVNRYVDGLDFKRDEIYGIFNRRLQLVAMAHLAILSDPNSFARACDFACAIRANQHAFHSCFE
jgi:hypothetical protein